MWRIMNEYKQKRDKPQTVQFGDVEAGGCSYRHFVARRDERMERWVLSLDPRAIGVLQFFGGELPRAH